MVLLFPDPVLPAINVCEDKEFKERFAAFEDGHASERVAEKIETWL